MSTSTAFKWSLSLPLLVPLLSPSFESVAPMLAYLLFGSLVIGGIPYAILAVSLLVFLHDSDERRIRRTLAAAPLLMVPVLWICMLAIIVVTTSPSTRDVSWEWIGGVSGYVIVIGYAYVAVVFSGIWALRRLRVLA